MAKICSKRFLGEVDFDLKNEVKYRVVMLDSIVDKVLKSNEIHFAKRIPSFLNTVLTILEKDVKHFIVSRIVHIADSVDNSIVVLLFH